MLKSYTKKSEHFAGLSHVSKAIGKDATRPQTHNIYVAENGDVVATDEHRLHLYRTEDRPLEPGFYRVLKSTKAQLELLKIESEYDFPDYKRVIPEPARADDNRPFSCTDTDSRYCEVIKQIGPRDGLNYKYFADGTGHAVTFYQQSECGPVRFDGAGTIAVIMPLRLRK